MQTLFDNLQAINYWESGPTRLGFDRKSYTDEIMNYLGSRTLKVLLGQRRSGKSTIF